MFITNSWWRGPGHESANNCAIGAQATVLTNHKFPKEFGQ